MSVEYFDPGTKNKTMSLNNNEEVNGQEGKRSNHHVGLASMIEKGERRGRPQTWTGQREPWCAEHDATMMLLTV